MARYSTVKLELIRPGPAHNQLLSPLTAYMALCGEGAPITFHVSLEHHGLLSRLARLRYVTPQGSGGVVVPDRVREETVGEIGVEVSHIFSEIHTLLAEIPRVHGEASEGADHENTRLVHLRLVLGGSELALIPFEMAISPQAFPGEGIEFCLQLNMPMVITREIRRSRPLRIPWDRPEEPRLLLISAAPQGLDIPLAAHVQAIRAAMEPWIRWPKDEPQDPGQLEQARLVYVKERLRLLTNASIEDIYEACAQETFTHVHILAHGSYEEVAGERRFGVALCERGDPATPQVVSGRRLAKALQAEGTDGSIRSNPVVVTLSMCDSGNPGSVLVPGGSIAHELHTAGIPWVFASQFPLTKVGSVRMAEALYRGLFRGDDPRQVLYEVRRRLHMSAERDHDWASIVVYASVADDFEAQVASFFESQTLRAIEIVLDRADDGDPISNMEKALNDVMPLLALWDARLPVGEDAPARARRARFYGIHGSTFKRIGLLHYSRAKLEPQQHAVGEAALRQSLSHYRRAMAEWSLDTDDHHWASTQALSLGALLGEPADTDTYHLAYMLAKRNLERRSLSSRAWAHGTLAELAMLALYHRGGQMASEAEILPRVVAHCKQIVTLMGEQSFHVASTRRQFQRYVDYWPWEWRQIAQAAVEALSPTATRAGAAKPSELPLYA